MSLPLLVSEWASSAAWSLVVLATCFVAGQIARRVASRRLATLAAKTRGQWDDIVVSELAQRIPFWSLLIGLYLAAGFWALPPNVANAVTKALLATLILSATLFSAAIVTKLTVLYGSRRPQALPVTSLTQIIAKGLVFTIGLLIALNSLGVSITPMLTALGVGGLAVALALQDTLANLFAGIYITLAGQIRVGDFLRLDSGEAGYVVDIGWRSTRLRMLPNNLVLVPNAKLSQAIVTNFYLPDKELAVLVEVGVDYDSSLPRVERVTCEVAADTLRSVSGGAAEFTPFIRYHTFADSSINFTVILRAREYADQYLIKHEFIKRLHERYRQEGITIPFPIRTMVQRAPVGGAPPAESSA